MIDRILRRYIIWKQVRSGHFSWLGTRVHFPPGSIVADQLIHTGQWDYDILAILLVAAGDGALAFDVGANIGATALPLLITHSHLHVVSFEPSPSVIGYLSRTQAESPFQDRWTIIAKAVTDTGGGETTFNRFVSLGGDVYDGIRNTGRGGAGIKTRVQTTSLDAEWKVRGRPKISLIKVDVEGAELEVLAGASECILACRPTIVTEWCPKNFAAYGHEAGAMIVAARNLGYAAYVIPELTPAAAEPLLKYQLSMRENLLLLPQ